MKNLFRIAAIIGALPVTLTNGTTADATQVMADLNWIVNQVNANAASLTNVALTNANNNFTVVQTGVAATAAAHFPIASQVQNGAFNTLSSTLGTNTITARVAELPLGAYVSGQVFTFIPTQTNTGPVGITIDAAGSSSIFSGGSFLMGGELQANVPAVVVRDSSKLNLVNPPTRRGSFTMTLTGFTPPITGTAIYSITNNVVSLFIPILTGTSDATTMTATGLPAAITPSVQRVSPQIPAEDNNAFTSTAIAIIKTDSTIAFSGQPSGVTTTWTAANTKGFHLGASLTYNL